MAQSEITTKQIDQAAFNKRNENDSGESSKKMKRIFFTILPYLPVVFWSIVTLYPFIFMVVMSTKSTIQMISEPANIFFASDWLSNLTLNYQQLMEKIPYFWNNVFNSIYIGFLATILSIFMSSLGGFGFAMYEFKGKAILLKLLIWSMAIPGILTIIPYFAMMSAIHWTNTARSIYITALCNAWGVYMMTQYTKSAIARDLVDAARIDGCSEFGIYWRVIIQLVRPMLGSLAILTFLSSWNGFFLPLVMFSDSKMFTIPVALNSIRGAADSSQGAVMLGAALAVIPVGIVFVSMSKWIIAGMTEGSIKD
jgi:multiple sugar transport system permease protein